MEQVALPLDDEQQQAPQGVELSTPERSPSVVSEKVELPTIDQQDYGVRKEKSQAEMMERIRLVAPDLDNAYIEEQVKRRNDEPADAIISSRRNEMIRQGRQEAMSQLIQEQNENAALLMPTWKEPSEGAIHREYGAQAASQLLVTTEEGEAVPEEMRFDWLDYAEGNLATISKIREAAVEIEEEYQQEANWFEWGVDVVTSVIPGTDRAAVLATEVPFNKYFTGGSNEDAIQWLYQQPDPGKALKDMAYDMASVSPMAAREFVQLAITHSADDILAKDVMDIFDITTTKVAVDAVKLLATAGRGVLKKGPKASNIAEAIGRNDQAAVGRVAEQIRDKANKKSKSGEPLEPGDVLPSTNPEDMLGTPEELLEAFTFVDNNAKAAYRFLNEKMQDPKVVQKAMDLVKARGISNVSAEDFARLAQDAYDEVLAHDMKFPGKRPLSYGVIEAGRGIETFGSPADRIIKGEKFSDGVDRLAVAFGNAEGQPFPTPNSANLWAINQLKVKDYEIVPTGAGQYIVQIQKPLNVNNLAQATVKTEASAVPDWLRNLVSDRFGMNKEEIADRRVIADTAGHVEVEMARLLEPMTKLGKPELSDVLDVMDQTRDFKNAAGKYVWPSRREFSDAFRRIHGKNVTDEQADAYEGLRQSNDLSYAMREMVAVAQATKQGVRHYDLFKGQTGFQGRVVDQQVKPFSQSTEDDQIMVILDDKGKIADRHFTGDSGYSNKAFEDIKLRLDSGDYELIETAGQYGAKVAGKNATHVLVPKRAVRTRDIRFGEMTPYRGGPSKIVEGRGFVRSADMSDNFLGKDRNWFSVQDLNAADELVKRLNAAREFMNKGDKAGWKAYIKENIPEILGRQMYAMKWDAPFASVKAGQTLADNADYLAELKTINPALRIRGRSRTDPLANLNTRFLGQRDEVPLRAVRDADEAGGIELVPSRLINPHEAVVAQMRNSFNVRVYDEYLDKNSMYFYRKFRNYMSPRWQKKFKENPSAHMRNVEWADGTPQWVKNQANRMARVQDDLIQMPTPTAERWNAWKAHISDQMNRSLSSATKEKGLFKILDERLLHTTNDPLAFWRGMAFHSKLGLFNPKHLFLQSMMVVNVMGVEGPVRMQSALRGYYASTGLRLTSSPDILMDTARKMAKDPTTEWKKAEHFIESHEAMEGFMDISSNIAAYERQAGPTAAGPLKSGWNKFTDAGLYFFKKGEQTSRATAWHAAYLGWRKKNPDAVFDQAAKQAVRLRASDLTANMTRDMNSAMQRGWPSLGTQFWSFQLRTMEQMLFGGPTLTAADRMKMFANYSMFFGLPVGVSAAMPFEFQDMARDIMAEMGIEDEDHPMLETIRDGLMSTGLSMLTGTDYNTAGLGPSGLPVFKDLYDTVFSERSRSEWYDLLGGAALSTVTESVAGGAQLASNLFDVTGLSGAEFSPGAEEWLEVFETISTVDQAKRAYYAIKAGEYINSKEQLTGIPLSGSEAVLSTMLGVQKDEIAAHYSRKNATSTLNRIKSEARTEAARLMDLAKTAVKTGDFEQAKEYHKRALIHASTGGLTRTQWNNLMKDKDQYQDVNKAYDRAIMRNKQFELRKQQAAHMGEQ